MESASVDDVIETVGAGEEGAAGNVQRVLGFGPEVGV